MKQRRYRPLGFAACMAFALGLAATPVHAATLRIDGEVYAQTTSALMPPAIDRLWNLNITQLAPDGAPVKAGDVVLGFDPSQLVKQLTEKQSLLKEKQSQFDKLVLELAERERNEQLATAQARADHEKAQRKTEQPAELVAGNEYRKLLIARELSDRKYALARRREALAIEQRLQERRMLAAEVAQLQGDVQRLTEAMASLTITAPRAGVMMHKSSWNGEKFDVGSQVWRGQTVAEIPDTGTLAVRAQLPERDYLRVRPGVPARIVIEGGAGRALNGKVASVGRAIRSKSRVQPVPVLDVEIRLDDPRAPLKPGQAVRVELTVTDAPAATSPGSRK